MWNKDDSYILFDVIKDAIRFLGYSIVQVNVDFMRFVAKQAAFRMSKEKNCIKAVVALNIKSFSFFLLKLSITVKNIFFFFILKANKLNKQEKTLKKSLMKGAN